MKRAKKHLRQISEVLAGTIGRKQGLYILEPDSEQWSGHVKSIAFNECMNAVVFDIKASRDLRLPLMRPKADMVYFLYCLKGDCSIFLNGAKKPIAIKELQSVILYSTKNSNSGILAGKGQHLLLSYIGINKARYQALFQGDFHGMDGRLSRLLDMVYEHENHFYLGNYNLKVGEYVKALHKHNYSHEVSAYLYFEGYCNLILANQIEQFYKNLNANSNTTGLTQDELKRIQEVSDYVKNYPEIQHSIKTISVKSGLSPNKLQEGFKFLHNRTVSDFVRNVRLEKAEVLIQTTDLNISEVVYSIGLTSRSYFCKIFKNKYNCSPKEYKSRSGNTVFKAK